MDYGHFSDDGKEYIITRPDTPVPWINYLFNNKYCALVSQTGGGYSFFMGSGYDRILRAFPGDMVQKDRPGRYIYIRDNDTGEYWSLNWQPVQANPDFWECRHGLGFTEIETRYDNITGKITYFVPRRDNLEVWKVKIKNAGKNKRNLSIFPFVEWCLSSYMPDLVERSFHNLFNDLRYEDGIILATKRYWPLVSFESEMTPNLKWDKLAFMSANFRIDGYETVRSNFLGRYRDWQNPLAVEKGALTNTAGEGFDSVGVLQHNTELAAGEELSFQVIVGVSSHTGLVKEIVQKYCEEKTCEVELYRVKRHWEEYLDQLTVETPDKDFNLSANIWNKYQAWVTANWSRMASYYIGGGSMLGFRDTAQDILGILPNDILFAKNRTQAIIEHQFHDGGCIHNWDPLTNIGPRTNHSDDALWLVMCILNYLKETGDINFLNQTINYYDRGKDSVYNHMLRGIEYSLSKRSPRKLSLMMAADWNDGLNFVGIHGKGESTMATEFLGWMLKEVSQLLYFIGEKNQAEKYEQEYRSLKERFNRYCWDGHWYWRATRDDGHLIGSHKNKEGKIHINAQTWAVMSGLATEERAAMCMDSLKSELDTEYGPCLFMPAYTEPDPHIGIITRFSPGTKENATIFNHPVSWAIIAECILKRADTAYSYWKKTSFITRGKKPEIYYAEPYVYAEYVYGPDHPNFGRGEFTWTTGTAAWMWRTCIDWILGIKPELEGLKIDPCIPKSWKGYKVKRNFRDAIYEITVKNPEKVSHGVLEIKADKKIIEGEILPNFSDEKVHKIEVLLGKKVRPD